MRCQLSCLIQVDACIAHRMTPFLVHIIMTIVFFAILDQQIVYRAVTAEEVSWSGTLLMQTGTQTSPHPQGSLYTHSVSATVTTNGNEQHNIVDISTSEEQHLTSSPPNIESFISSPSKPAGTASVAEWSVTHSSPEVTMMETKEIAATVAENTTDSETTMAPSPHQSKHENVSTKGFTAEMTTPGTEVDVTNVTKLKTVTSSEPVVSTENVTVTDDSTHFTESTVEQTVQSVITSATPEENAMNATSQGEKFFSTASIYYEPDGGHSTSASSGEEPTKNIPSTAQQKTLDVTTEMVSASTSSNKTAQIALGIGVAIGVLVLLGAAFILYKRKCKKDRGYETLDDFGIFEGLQNPTYNDNHYDL